MKFWQFLRFPQPKLLPDLAKISEDAGYYGAMLVDHMFVPEELKSPSSYTSETDGNSFWSVEDPWPDPWSAIGAMASVTSRMKFSTNIFVLPLRNPFDVAKSASTISQISKNRLIMGFGSGWMEEEYKAMGVDFKTRGKRYTEMLEILPLLWKNEMVEYHGEIFDFPPLQMCPTPAGKIPIYLGGNAKVAKRRAARMADGWLMQRFSRKTIGDMIKEMHDFLGENNRSRDSFEIIVTATGNKDAYKQFEDAGVTGIINLPDPKTEIGPNVPLDQMKRYIEDYAENFIVKM